MAKHSFPYSIHTDWETHDNVYRPMLPVRVSAGKAGIPLSFLVDSGSYDTLVSAEFAEVLGIDLKKCPTRGIVGVGGVEKEGRVHPLTIEIRNPKFKHPLQVDAVFVEKLGVEGLLGQRDFFRNYYVRFQQPEASFVIEEVPALEWDS